MKYLIYLYVFDTIYCSCSSCSQFYYIGIEYDSKCLNIYNVFTLLRWMAHGLQLI